MAGGAHSNGGLRVIKLGNRLPARRKFVVASLTLITRSQSDQMLPSQAARLHTIVASHATVHETGMTDGSRFPGRNRMAGIALFNGGNVI